MNVNILFGSMIYALAGIIIFMLAYLIFNRVAAKSEVTKIIVEQNNTGLGIVIAGLFIGLAIIISSAIK